MHEHLPAPAREEHIQGVRGHEHLPAPAREEPLEGVRGRGRLAAPAREEHMQGVRRYEHLPAPAPEKHMQGVRRAGVCQHQQQRSRCKECGGANICLHQRKRSHCKECGSTSPCPHLHQRQRDRCRECGGTRICLHQRRRSRCKECRLEADESMPAGLEELEDRGTQDDGEGCQPLAHFLATVPAARRRLREKAVGFEATAEPMDVQCGGYSTTLSLPPFTHAGYHQHIYTGVRTGMVVKRAGNGASTKLPRASPRRGRHRRRRAEEPAPPMGCVSAPFTLRVSAPRMLRVLAPPLLRVSCVEGALGCVSTPYRVCHHTREY